MDPGVPNWGRIPALAVTGAPALVAVGAGHELRLPTAPVDRVTGCVCRLRRARSC